MINFEEILDGVFAPGTDEYDTIKDSYDLIVGTVPSIAAEAKTHMILLDHARTKMSTIYYMISRAVSYKRNTFQSTYDAAYSRLVKLGRPSNAAIEAEIRATNPEYSGASFEIEKLEQVEELVSMYIRCIDAAKLTATEILKDSRRID